MIGPLLAQDVLNFSSPYILIIKNKNLQERTVLIIVRGMASFQYYFGIQPLQSTKCWKKKTGRQVVFYSN